MLTESGFPKNIKSPNHLLRLLYKRKAYNLPVELHRNLEPETGLLHNTMWNLANAGKIEIVHGKMPADSSHINDVQFSVRMTIPCYQEIRSRRLTLYVAVISTFGAIVSIFTLFRPFILGK